MPEPSIQPPSRRSLIAALTLGLTLGISVPCGGQNPMQQQQVPGMANPRTTQSSPTFGTEPADPVVEEKRLRLLNIERQKAMVADAAKLLNFARSLQAEVASGQLTLQELHKLNEIEKLAHSVKEKMSTSVRGVPAFVQEPNPLFR